jgi:hypothetical protein
VIKLGRSYAQQERLLSPINPPAVCDPEEGYEGFAVCWFHHQLGAVR